MPTDTPAPHQIHKSGSFPEQTVSQGTQAPQSVLDTISEQAVDEQTKEKLEKKKFSLLPPLNVEMFFNRSHLKRRVKVLVGVYCIVIFGALAYGLHTIWQKNTELTQTWEQRDRQYVQKLTAVDLSDLSEISAQLDSGVQIERDPVWALFTIEQLAQEAQVNVLNPTYTISSVDIENDAGIALSVLVHGTGENILAFLDLIQGTKPVLQILSTRVQPIENGVYQAILHVEYLYTTKVDEKIDGVEEKFTTGIFVDYPLAGIGKIMEQLEGLRVIVMDKVGTFVLGKTDLFAS